MKKFFILLFPVLLACNSQQTEIKQAPASVSPIVKKTFTSGIPEFREGDIIFQSTSDGQGKAIQLATRSPYSHVGILLKKGNELMVFEAVQPVKVTSLEKFIVRGDRGHYVVKRLKDAGNILSEEKLALMRRQAEKHLDKNYDLYFEWTNSKMYCSELVWKVYKEGAGIEPGKLQKLKDFNLDHPVVQYKLKERYGKNIPYEQTVISPSAVFDSDLLEEVYRE